MPIFLKKNSRWSKIASHLPGRTDNEIKNHWNTHIKKKLKKMGIDPVTHKPLSNTTEQTQTKPQEEQHQQQQSFPVDQDPKLESEKDQNKEPEKPEASFESSTITEVKEEDQIMTPLFDSMDPMNGFCTDEVPIIEPDEILAPCDPSTSSTSTSSSSSSSYSNSSCKFIEDLLLSDFEWPQNNYNENNVNNSSNNNNNISINNNSSMTLWDDDFISSWDLLINDDDGDRKQVFDAPLNQYPRMIMDSESWAYGLL